MPRKVLEGKQMTYTTWRNRVLERDGHRCVQCKSKKNLEADHIKPVRTHPDLARDVENGRTLCKRCHIKTDTYGGKPLKGTRMCRDPYNANCFCCRTQSQAKSND